MKEQNVITEKDIISALHSVLGPDGKTPLPTSGALSGLTTVGSKVFVSIAIDAARQVELEPMRRNAEAALRACGYTPNRILTGGGSDANVFEARGLPCTNLANGTERNHEPGERVSQAALEGMLDVTFALLDELSS